MLPIVADNHGLAIDQERGILDAECSINDRGEAVRPVVAPPGEATHAVAVPAHLSIEIDRCMISPPSRTRTQLFDGSRSLPLMASQTHLTFLLVV